MSAALSVGDRVRARGLPGSGHTRLPEYLRGRVGVVLAARGRFALADDRATGAPSPRVEPLYTVAFEGEEVWGAGAEPRTSVTADLWDSYLEKIG